MSVLSDKVIQTILDERLIVIVRGVEGEKLLPLARAMYDGGVRLIEFTFGSKTMKDDDETAEYIGRVAREFEGRMFVGSGTVTTPRQAELTAEAGGAFVISPNTDAEVIKRTKELGMVSIPGALTPTEIVAADHAGADFVKLFTVTTMGPDYVKAVKAPLSGVRLLAVGGVSYENMEAYFKAGVCGFGLGSNIVDMKRIAEGDFEGITALAEKNVNYIKQL